MFAALKARSQAFGPISDECHLQRVIMRYLTDCHAGNFVTRRIEADWLDW